MVHPDLEKRSWLDARARALPCVASQQPTGTSARTHGASEEGNAMPRELKPTSNATRAFCRASTSP